MSTVQMEEPEFIAWNPRTNADIGVHTCNSRAGELEIGGCWGWLIHQLRPLGQPQARERFCLKNKTAAKVNVSKGTASRTDL